MSGSAGLDVQDVVNVSISLSPQAAGTRNFGALMILGDSDVIDVSQRYRQYSTLAQVAADFGTSAAEYLGADAFYSQNPQPNLLYIGRWARTATAGLLRTKVFSPAQQVTLLSTLAVISTGSIDFTIDGVARNLTSLDFTSAANLNAAAAVISTGLSTHGSCVWNSVLGQFIIESSTTGASSTVAYAAAGGSGTDISATIGATQAAGAQTPVPGIIAETPLACVALFAALTNLWYGLQFSASTQPSASDNIAVGTLIEGLSPRRIFGTTSEDTNILLANVSSDVASELKALGLNRTFTQYCSSSLYASASIFGRAFTTNFLANNSTITLKFKQEPGIVAETLTESQAAAIGGKNCNVFVNYNNATAIIQEGVMASGQFFDTVQGTDWLQNQVQTAVFNELFQSPTKLPLTDPGVGIIVAVIEGALGLAVNNGLLAPGIWTGPSFGQLQTGQLLTKGFYTYAPPVSTLTDAQRTKRIAPTIQVAAKGAGAIHFVNVLIDFNS